MGKIEYDTSGQVSDSPGAQRTRLVEANNTLGCYTFHASSWPKSCLLFRPVVNSVTSRTVDHPHPSLIYPAPTSSIHHDALQCLHQILIRTLPRR
ncbi:Uncharacterized protein HZ326_21698 [Fusarium oxysporum f. sp. albedinis]|nr:Uncharacterized protein HZ326_21698 [Fusarium oxysporum f. sp. albedinis]